MKKLFFAIAAMMISSFGFAQGFGGGFGGGDFDPAQMAQRQVDRVAEGLDLTQAQKDSLLTFYTAQQKEQAERMQKMMEEGGGFGMGEGPSEDMMKEMQARREATEKKLKSILTEEQYEKYQKAQEERRAQMQQGGGFGGFGGGFGGM